MGSPGPKPLHYPQNLSEDRETGEALPSLMRNVVTSCCLQSGFRMQIHKVATESGLELHRGS